MVARSLKYFEATSKSLKMSYTQFTVTLFIRGLFLRQNQSWLSYTVTVLVVIYPSCYLFKRYLGMKTIDHSRLKTSLENLLRINKVYPRDILIRYRVYETHFVAIMYN